MNRRNPLDWFFKRKLQYFSVEAPMNVWERIDAQREQQKQLALQGRKRWSILLLFLFLITVGLSSLLLISSSKEEPTLSNFPILLQPMANSSGDPAAIIEEDPTNVSADLLLVENQNKSETPANLAATNFPTKKKLISVAPIGSFRVESLSEHTHEMQSARPLMTSMASLPVVNHFIKSKNRFSDGVKCAEFKPEEKGKWTLDILASPDWSFRSLTPKESAYAAYVQSREATESADFNYSAGIRVSYVHPSGLLGRVGLNYSQINEKFESSTENEEVITIRNIYGPGGDVIGTDTLIETNLNRSFTNNRFESIDIPVIFGYEKSFKKLTISANAGFLFNVLFHSKGDFLSPMNGEPVSFDENTPGSYPAFRNSLGVGLYAGVSLAYPINPKLQFIVEPHLKTYPKTITRDQYMVNQKYLLTGLSIGLRHQM